MTEANTIEAQLITARRHQILDGATKVFAEKGFHGATVRDVARAAGVADGTIYNYFANKNALVLGILDRLTATPTQESQFESAAAMGIEAWSQVYIQQRAQMMGPESDQILQAILPEVLTNAEVRQSYVQQVIEPAAVMAEKFFRQWVAEGKVNDFDPALALRAISGLFLGLTMLRLIGDEPVQTRWDEMAVVANQLVLHGLVKQGV
jgi:AcrR family transcriptional regulator